MKTSLSCLRCNYLQHAIGLEDAAPRLFWQLATAREGVSQTAYEIRVASLPAAINKHENEHDFWDLGRLGSDWKIENDTFSWRLGRGKRARSAN